MQKLLLIVAAIGVAAVPASAQTLMTPDVSAANQTVANQAVANAAPKPKTVQKRVCEKVEVERSTGSRLSSTTRICKTIEVPVPQTDGQPPASTGPNERH
jgi:hypothetical protein